MGYYDNLPPVAQLPQADIAGNTLRWQQVRQNKLLQASQQAQSDAAAQSIDKDGNYDSAKFNRLLSANPDAHYNMQPALTENNNQRSQQLANQDADLSLHAKRAGMMAGLVSPYLSKQGLRKADLAPAFGAALSHGLISMDQAQKEYAGLPDDEDSLRKSMRGFFNAAAGPQHGYNDGFGNVQMIDDGGQLRFVKVASPGGGGGASDTGTGVEKTLTPGEASTPTNIKLGNGQDLQTNLSHYTQAVNGHTKPTVPLDVMGDGRYPSQQTTDPSHDMAGIPGPVPGDVDAQQTAARASAEDANRLNQMGTHRNDRMSVLGNMAQDLERFPSGPGRETYRHYAAVLNNTFGTAIKAEEIQDAQSFNKFSAQLAQEQAKTLGAGTDGKLASAIAANPNSALQGNTNRLMLHQLMGNEDAINAKATAWQKSGLSPAQYHQWNQQFSQNFDPRAFQVIRMPPDEQRQIFDEMDKSKQLDEFRRHYNAMKRAGLFQHGDQ